MGRPGTTEVGIGLGLANPMLAPVGPAINTAVQLPSLPGLVGDVIGGGSEQEKAEERRRRERGG